ncbi:MAG: hypothetical protein EOP06_03460 [Proteobacteria bacterium]|nr:MAG: hypothetical protein EOP06_03460 [Pseudomonadota bacterium]
MRFLILILVSVISAPALSDTSEVIIRTNCDTYNTNGFIRYITSENAEDSRVKIDIRLSENVDEGLSNSYTVKSPILSQLERRGEVVVHKRSGAVCAKLSKPLIGKRSYHSMSNCAIVIKDVEIVTNHLDADGFEQILSKSCVRSFLLNTK